MEGGGKAVGFCFVWECAFSGLLVFETGRPMGRKSGFPKRHKISPPSGIPASRHRTSKVLGRLIGEVTIGRRSGLLFPPLLNNPCVNLRFDPFGQIGVYSKPQFFLGPVTVQACLIDNPGRARFLSIAVLSGVRNRDELNPSPVSVRDNLDNLHHDWRIAPLRTAFAQSYCDSKDWRISFK